MLKNPFHNKHVRDSAIKITSTYFVVFSFLYAGYVFWSLREENINLKKEVLEIQSYAELTQQSLNKERDEKTAIITLLQAEKQNNVYFQDQIQNIVGTVSVLEKLSKTDTELLKKYSKVYFLNENYIPEKLVEIDPKYNHDKNKIIKIHENVYPFLKTMLDNAEKEGVLIKILSGYRSFGEQASLKSTYSVTYGAGTANKFSADQGYSEHQLGTTLDFTNTKIGAVLSGFDKTNEYKWLLDNAYKYGFVMSYPKENRYYIFEPWHWRFVGIMLAQKLKQENNFFYALDQRDINQFLANIFD